MPRPGVEQQTDIVPRRAALAFPVPPLPITWARGHTMRNTLPKLLRVEFPSIRRAALQTLQVNLGYRCNQACLHCHVNAGPQRKEMMQRETVEQVVAFATAAGVTTLDVTGGAPELNPHFRRLISVARGLGLHVIDRCNLTVLESAGQESTMKFLADHWVEITASLPCYLQENVDGQRGSGVYESSIRVLRRLNQLGYGAKESGLILNLVYNPTGPVLPPAQRDLELDYRNRLGEEHGIVFNRLLTLANMPIQRFGSTLLSRGQFDAYMTLLRDAHQERNLQTVMCRTLLSVDWRGYVYDCDFNQMLQLPLPAGRRHITELNASELANSPIRVAGHCYGCTAGQGSGCSGALT